MSFYNNIPNPLAEDIRIFSHLLPALETHSLPQQILNDVRQLKDNALELNTQLSIAQEDILRDMRAYDFIHHMAACLRHNPVLYDFIKSLNDTGAWMLSDVLAKWGDDAGDTLVVPAITGHFICYVYYDQEGGTEEVGYVLSAAGRQAFDLVNKPRWIDFYDFGLLIRLLQEEKLTGRHLELEQAQARLGWSRDRTASVADSVRRFLALGFSSRLRQAFLIEATDVKAVHLFYQPEVQSALRHIDRILERVEIESSQVKEQSIVEFSVPEGREGAIVIGTEDQRAIQEMVEQSRLQVPPSEESWIARIFDDNTAQNVFLISGKSPDGVVGAAKLFYESIERILLDKGDDPFILGKQGLLEKGIYPQTLPF